VFVYQQGCVMWLSEPQRILSIKITATESKKTYITLPVEKWNLERTKLKF
jgi:hypothetical protein